MKIFQIVRKQYAIVGLCSPSDHPHNGKILVGFLLFACNLASHMVYIYRVADGFMEYMTCICSISATFTMFVCYAAFVYRKAKLFNCADELGELVETSKMVKNSYYIT